MKYENGFNKRNSQDNTDALAHWFIVPSWDTYDPAWLVSLAREQYPNEAWLANALARCIRAKKYNGYVYFVDSANGNRPGAAGQFERNIVLNDPELGEIVVDILQGDRVGGIEMWARIFK